MLMAHWDTREIADKDPNPENHNKPILGANDGASGTAVLMVLTEIIESNTLDNIVFNAKKIAKSGVKEIVLTGVNIGDFGQSTGEQFSDLISDFYNLVHYYNCTIYHNPAQYY